MAQSLGRRGYMSESICWKCMHAVYGKTRGCSWSASGVPVKGSRMIGNMVVFCPKFAEGPSETEFTDKGTENLAAAILVSAGKDYLRQCRAYAKSEALRSWTRQANVFAKFYGMTATEEAWKPAGGPPWCKWIGPPPKPLATMLNEIFFTGDWAASMIDGSPAYIMNRARKSVGLDPIRVERTYKDCKYALPPPKKANSKKKKKRVKRKALTSKDDELLMKLYGEREEDDSDED